MYLFLFIPESECQGILIIVNVGKPQYLIRSKQNLKMEKKLLASVTFVCCIKGGFNKCKIEETKSFTKTNKSVEQTCVTRDT